MIVILSNRNIKQDSKSKDLNDLCLFEDFNYVYHEMTIKIHNAAYLIAYVTENKFKVFKCLSKSCEPIVYDKKELQEIINAHL